MGRAPIDIHAGEFYLWRLCATAHHVTAFDTHAREEETDQPPVPRQKLSPQDNDVGPRSPAFHFLMGRV